MKNLVLILVLVLVCSNGLQANHSFINMVDCDCEELVKNLSKDEYIIFGSQVKKDKDKISNIVLAYMSSYYINNSSSSDNFPFVSDESTGKLCLYIKGKTIGSVAADNFEIYVKNFWGKIYFKSENQKIEKATNDFVNCINFSVNQGVPSKFTIKVKRKSDGKSAEFSVTK